MLTIGNIVQWEQLRKKSFIDFDVNDEEDKLVLTFVISGKRSRYSAFKAAISEADVARDVREYINEINSEFKYLGQFMLDKNDDDIENSSSDGAKAKISTIIGQIIFNGADVKNLLSLGIEWIPWISESFGEYEKNKKLEHRLWARVSLSPYVKEGTTLHQFLPFPWEDAADNVSDLDIKTAKFLFKQNEKFKIRKK